MPKNKLTDSEIVAVFMKDLLHPQLALIQTIRATIKAVDDRIQERIKWNAPSYHVDNIDFLTFGPMNRPTTLLVFHHPSIIAFPSEYLEGNYKDRRLMYFKDDIDLSKKLESLTKNINFTLTKINK